MKLMTKNIIYRTSHQHLKMLSFEQCLKTLNDLTKYKSHGVVRQLFYLNKPFLGGCHVTNCFIRCVASFVSCVSLRKKLTHFLPSLNFKFEKHGNFTSKNENVLYLITSFFCISS